MAGAEIEAQQAADPVQVACQQRLIEAVLSAQRGKGIGPRIGAQHDQGRIAGQHLDDGEHDHRRQSQSDERGGEPPGQELDHAFQ